MIWLRVDVSDHDCLTVTSDRVFQEIGQFALAVGDVISFVVTHTHHYLLKEGQGFVDVGSFL